MLDLAPMIIFINHSLYVSYSSFPNMGPRCYKLPHLNPWRPRQATSCNAPVPHDLLLLGGLDSIYNDPRKSASHICGITPKRQVNLDLS
jgi:hypothetical protein